MRPNLFSYATSELSQDAILAWMLAWADSKYRAVDAATHKLGVNFLRLIYQKYDQTLSGKKRTVRVETQKDQIDVLAVVDDSIAILIEDKVGTEEHSDQLARYRQTVGETFSDENIFAVYVQTHEQGSYKNVVDNRYVPIGRAELLSLLARYSKAGGTNEIALDFHQHLLGLEQRFGSYRIAPLEDWRWYGWQGFFVELSDRLKSGKWEHVPNASGGFWAMWWDFEKGKTGYLQLEESRLCFKIEVIGDTGERRRQRSDWHRRVVRAGDALGLSIKKPTRYGNGRTMTVAVVSDKFVSFDTKGALDWARMAKTHELARRVLRRAAEDGS